VYLALLDGEVNALENLLALNCHVKVFDLELQSRSESPREFESI